MDIQIEIGSILTLNLKLREETGEIKDSANLNEEIKDLKDSLLKTEDENNSLKILPHDTRRELKTMKDHFGGLKEESGQLWSTLDYLEQYTRKNSLERPEMPQPCEFYTRYFGKT